VGFGVYAVLLCLGMYQLLLFIAISGSKKSAAEGTHRLTFRLTFVAVSFCVI